MEPTLADRRLAIRATIAILVGVVLLAIALPRWLWDSAIVLLFLGYLFGTPFAHAVAAAAWTALGPAPLQNRLTFSLIWGIGILLALALNLFFGSGGSGAVIVAFAIALFGVWIFGQIPFWLLSGFGRITVARPLPDAAGALTQYGIVHLLGFTTIIAVLLGAGRLLIQWWPSNIDVSEFVILFFFGVTTILRCLPLLLAALLPRFAFPAVLVLLLLTTLSAWWESTLLREIIDSVPGIDYWFFLSVNIISAAWILLLTLLVRLAGYRLVRG